MKSLSYGPPRMEFPGLIDGAGRQKQNAVFYRD